MWGNQFYVDVSPVQINEAKFFSPDDPGGELLLRERLPIRQEQWEAIEAAVKELTPNLKEQKRQKSSQKLDGGEFHILTLTWNRNGKEQETTYSWPADGSAEKLEQLLETMVFQLA